jgi:uncharacterized membrane protein YphA (DoxX/SURF4 family)
VARTALAVVFAYQGIVPKLLFAHVDEIAMVRAAGVPPQLTGTAVAALGIGEVATAAALLAAWSRSWPAWLSLAAMPIAAIVVVLFSPVFFAAAFNPFSLNVSVAALAVVDLLVMAGVPSAGRRLRRPAPEKP